MFGQGFEDGYGQLFDQCVIIDATAAEEESSTGPSFFRDVKSSSQCGSPDGHDAAAGTQFGLDVAAVGHLDHSTPWPIPRSYPSDTTGALSSRTPQSGRARFYQEASGRAALSDSELVGLQSGSQIKSRAPPPSSTSREPSSQTITPTFSSSHSFSHPGASPSALQGRPSSTNMMHTPLHMRSDSTPVMLREWASDVDLASSRIVAASLSNGMPLSPPPSAKFPGGLHRFPTASAAGESFDDFTYSQGGQDGQGFSGHSQAQLTPLPSPRAGAPRTGALAAKHHASKSDSEFSFSAHAFFEHNLAPRTPSHHSSPWGANQNDDALSFAFVGDSSDFTGGDQSRSWWPSVSHAAGTSQPHAPQGYHHASVQEATKSLAEMTGLMGGDDYGLGDDGATHTSASIANHGLLISGGSPHDVAVYDDQDSDMMLDGGQHGQSQNFWPSSPSQEFPQHRGSMSGLSAERDSLHMTPSTTPSRPRGQNPLHHRRQGSHQDPHLRHSRTSSFNHSPTPSPTIRASKPRQASRCRKASSNKNSSKTAETAAAAAIAAAVHAPRTPQPLSSNPSPAVNGKAHPRTPSTSSNASTSSTSSSHNNQPRTPSSPLGFVNFTPSDSRKILTGVAPSGSSKTKARREKEAREKNRKLSMAAMKAVQAVGGDMSMLDSEDMI